MRRRAPSAPRGCQGRPLRRDCGATFTPGLPHGRRPAERSRRQAVCGLLSGSAVLPAPAVQSSSRSSAHRARVESKETLLQGHLGNAAPRLPAPALWEELGSGERPCQLPAELPW